MRGLLSSVLASAAAAMHGEGPKWGDAEQFRNTSWTPGGAPGLANKGKARWKRLRRVRG